MLAIMPHKLTELRAKHERKMSRFKKSAAAGCARNCGHSAEEHAAFDAGLQAGIDGVPESECPTYATFELREIWRIGHSVNYKGNA